MVPNLDIFGFFCKTFQLDKFEGADFKYDNSFLKILGWKYKAFLVPNLDIFLLFFWQNFAVKQILGCRFQIWKWYVQLGAPKSAILAFFVPNKRLFIFCTKLCNKANWRALISNMTMVFQNCYPKHSKKASLIPNLSILTFEQNFPIR